MRPEFQSNISAVRLRWRLPAGSEAHFSKVPKLFGSISGATIPFISSQRRGSKPSNSAILLVFLILKTCKKISFSKQADCSLTTSFSGPKSSRYFRETGPSTLVYIENYPGIWKKLKERRGAFPSFFHKPFCSPVANTINVCANKHLEVLVPAQSIYKRKRMQQVHVNQRPLNNWSDEITTWSLIEQTCSDHSKLFSTVQAVNEEHTDIKIALISDH